MVRVVNGTRLSKHPNRIKHEIEDLKGNQYGELTVIEYDSRDHYGRARWICKCSCGKTKVIDARHLKSGRIISCGHVNREKSAQRIKKYTQSKSSYKDGYSKEPWANCYSAMCQRVRNICLGATDYKSEHYRKLIHGKLIEVDWLNDPYLFYQEIQGEYHPGDSIHRIDNHKGYVRGNVKWANRKEQAHFRDYCNSCKDLPQGIVLAPRGVNRRVRDKYHATIVVNRKTFNLGYYYHLQDAMIARYYAECVYNFPHHFDSPSLLHPYQKELPDINREAQRKGKFKQKYGQSDCKAHIYTLVEQWNADHTKRLGVYNSIRQASVLTGVNRKKISKIAKTYKLNGSPYDFEIIGKKNK